MHVALESARDLAHDVIDYPMLQELIDRAIELQWRSIRTATLEDVRSPWIDLGGES